MLRAQQAVVVKYSGWSLGVWKKSEAQWTMPYKQERERKTKRIMGKREGKLSCDVCVKCLCTRWKRENENLYF